MANRREVRHRMFLGIHRWLACALGPRVVARARGRYHPRGVSWRAAAVGLLVSCLTSSCLGQGPGPSVTPRPAAPTGRRFPPVWPAWPKSLFPRKSAVETLTPNPFAVYGATEQQRLAEQLSGAVPLPQDPFRRPATDSAASAAPPPNAYPSYPWPAPVSSGAAPLPAPPPASTAISEVQGFAPGPPVLPSPVSGSFVPTGSEAATSIPSVPHDFAAVAASGAPGLSTPGPVKIDADIWGAAVPNAAQETATVTTLLPESTTTPVESPAHPDTAVASAAIPPAVDNVQASAQSRLPQRSREPEMSTTVLAIVGDQTVLAGDLLGPINQVLAQYEGQVPSWQLEAERRNQLLANCPKLSKQSC